MLLIILILIFYFESFCIIIFKKNYPLIFDCFGIEYHDLFSNKMPLV